MLCVNIYTNIIQFISHILSCTLVLSRGIRGGIILNSIVYICGDMQMLYFYMTVFIFIHIH